MHFTDIRPFIRYVHYVPLGKISQYPDTIPYDNRLFYMYKGTASIKTTNECYTLNEGDILLIPSGHRYRLLPSENTSSYIAVNFDYTQANIEKHNVIYPAEADKYNRSLKLEEVSFKDTPQLNSIVCIRGMREVAGKLVRIEQEYSEKLLYSEFITSNTMSELLFECARKLNGQNHKENKEIVGMIIGYINDNIEKKLSNKIIAENFNLHPNYISSVMKIYTGIPLHQYLLKARISRSIDLISEQKYSLTEIAEKCGFSDIYHYSKSFKKIIGVSPGTYNKSTIT